LRSRASLLRPGNCSRIPVNSRLRGVASDETFDVITQTGQNIELGGSNAQEIEARLQQILESMRVDPPADTDPPETDDDYPDTGPAIAPATASATGSDESLAGFPPFMRLPSQSQSVTRLGQAMVDRGLITQDDLARSNTSAPPASASANRSSTSARSRASSSRRRWPTTWASRSSTSRRTRPTSSWRA